MVKVHKKPLCPVFFPAPLSRALYLLPDGPCTEDEEQQPRRPSRRSRNYGPQHTAMYGHRRNADGVPEEIHAVEEDEGVREVQRYDGCDDQYGLKPVF